MDSCSCRQARRAEGGDLLPRATARGAKWLRVEATASNVTQVNESNLDASQHLAVVEAAAQQLVQ
uniref:Uncharacterized protein n=1 Tax=Oryza meridionalis TaxID=40149 RepID=A0A0E0C8L5_9ORYZ